MIDSPTLKAIASTILTFAFVISVGALTSAIGQNTGPRATTPAANPYENVESGNNPAAHNQAGPNVSAQNAGHNMP